MNIQKKMPKIMKWCSLAFGLILSQFYLQRLQGN
jgi:hypothetical protein